MGEIAGTRILIVEDEAVVVMMLEAMLDELGCPAVGVASRIEEAQEMLRTLPFDCALLDINLAGLPVYPLALQLAERGTPFVFVTGYDRLDLAEEFRGRPVLRKPFDIGSLKHAVAAATQRDRGASAAPGG